MAEIEESRPIGFGPKEPFYAKGSYNPPFAGPKILTLTDSKEDVSALKALGFDAVIPGSRKLPNLDFAKGCPPIIVAMGYGWAEEERTRRICKTLGDRFPVVASSFNYHFVCREKPEELPVHSVIFSDSKDVSEHRSKLITCMKRDRLKACKLWEAINLPADRIFRPANQLQESNGERL